MEIDKNERSSERQHERKKREKKEKKKRKKREKKEKTTERRQNDGARATSHEPPPLKGKDRLN